MALSQQGLNLIANFEGVRLYAYEDPVGHCTTGIGHLIHEGGCTVRDYDRYGNVQHPKLTRAQAFELLQEDLRPRIAAVERLVRVPMTPGILAACTSLLFNIGEGAFRDSTVLRELNKGNYKKAAAAFMLWVKAGGVTWEGLVRRRRAERDMFLRGVARLPVLTETEQNHLRILRAKGISARKRRRARDWLEHQARKIQKAARGEKGGWEKHHRAQRYQRLRRALKRAR